MPAESSLSQDLGAYIERVAKLFRLDAALLSIETKQNLQSIAISLIVIVAAFAAAFLGVIVLLFAAVLYLVQLGWTPSFAALVVGAVLLLISAALAFTGVQRLKSWSLAPRRAMAQFNSNLQALRASFSHDANN